MEAHINQYSMNALCEALKVSHSGFYKWRERQKKGQLSNPIDSVVHQVFQVHKGRAGAKVLTQDIRATGIRVSERTVGRSLSRQQLRHRHPRRFKVTTDSNHNLAVASNLLNRSFTVGAPNQVWVGDITYIKVTEGWLYLAVMIDLFSRQVVGWQMSSTIDQTLVNDALQAALLTRGYPKGVMIHTDRGSQYCAHSFKRIIAQHQLVQSMSRKGNCWDNAVAESFFASLKKQAIHHHPVKSRADMKTHIFEYIEIYYNRVRRHMANNWLTPVEFERLYNQN